MKLISLTSALVSQTLAINLSSTLLGDKLPAPVYDARIRAKEHRDAWQKSKGKFETIEQGLINSHADA